MSRNKVTLAPYAVSKCGKAARNADFQTLYSWKLKVNRAQLHPQEIDGGEIKQRSIVCHNRWRTAVIWERGRKEMPLEERRRLTSQRVLDLTLVKPDVILDSRTFHIQVLVHLSI